MSKRKILQRPERFTKGDLEHAAESAREMVAEDSTLQHLLNFMIISRRLYMVGRSALDNEIKGSWEVDDPELIIQTLVMSCQDKANEKFKILPLQQSVLSEIVPVLDILVRQTLETGQDIDGESTSEENDGTRSDQECDVSGSDAGGEARGGKPTTGAKEGQTDGRGAVGGGAPSADRAEQGEGDPLADDGVHPGDHAN
jgi:hypothetical protein